MERTGTQGRRAHSGHREGPPRGSSGRFQSRGRDTANGGGPRDSRRRDPSTGDGRGRSERSEKKGFADGANDRAPRGRSTGREDVSNGHRGRSFGPRGERGDHANEHQDRQRRGRSTGPDDWNGSGHQDEREDRGRRGRSTRPEERANGYSNGHQDARRGKSSGPGYQQRGRSFGPGDQRRSTGPSESRNRKLQPRDCEDPDYVHHIDIETAKKTISNEFKLKRLPLTVDPPRYKQCAVESFDELGLCDELYRGLNELGYAHITPIQSLSVPVGLKGKDLVTIAQTGSGKTLCFLLVAGQRLMDAGELSDHDEVDLSFYPGCVIVSPTRELALQITEHASVLFVKSPLRVGTAYGQVKQIRQIDELRDSCRQRGLQSGCDILVGCPGRLKDVSEKRQYDLCRVRILILDEADCLLDMGFEDEMKFISRESGMPADRQTLFFSATFGANELRFAQNFVKDKCVIVRGEVDHSLPKGLDIKFIECEHRELSDVLRDKIAEMRKKRGHAIMFFPRKVDTRHYGDKFQALTLHGDMTQKKREESFEKFRKGDQGILMATDVAQRGLDMVVSDVFNIGLPKNQDAFLHRAGRTARRGTKGTLHQIVITGEPNGALAGIVEVLKKNGKEVPGWVSKMAANHRPRARSVPARR